MKASTVKTLKNLFKKVIQDHLPRILAILLMVIPMFSSASDCLTMVKTLHQLDDISDEIRYVEEVANNSKNKWDSEDVKKYEELVAKRNKIINSSDPLVSEFASSSNLKRIGMFLSEFAIIALMGYCAYRMVRFGIRSLKRFLSK